MKDRVYDWLYKTYDRLFPEPETIQAAEELGSHVYYLPFHSIITGHKAAIIIRSKGKKMKLSDNAIAYIKGRTAIVLQKRIDIVEEMELTETNDDFRIRFIRLTT